MAALRSWLYVPGDRPERFARAFASGADAVILDLEDGVAGGARPRAIAQVDAWLAALAAEAPAQAWVRVDDARVRDSRVQALARHARLAGFVLPKLESPEQARGWGKPVVGILETPRAVAHAADLVERAVACGLVGVALGPEDLSAALGVAPTHASLHYPAAAVAIAAHAAGVAAFSCPGSIGQFRELEAWRATLEAGRALGSHGNWCIHPAQVAVVNAVFSPTEAERAWAARVAAAWEAAGGAGALAVDGRMVDAPVLARAHRILRHPKD